MEISLASKIGFSKLCSVLEAIKKADSSRKASIFADFLQRCRVLASKIKTEFPDADTSLYPILRLMLPDRDRERKAYNLKQKNLAALYIRIFCIAKQNADAQSLINYKAPTGKKSAGADFAERVYCVLRNRMPKDNTTFTVEQINLFLDDISGTSETDKQKDDLFIDLVKRVNAGELKWITRIILKDLKLGFGSQKILHVFHPDAVASYNVTSDLRQLCDKLYDPQARHQQKIEIFSHVKPMLLEKITIEDIGKLFTNEEVYYAQPKFDGERSQMHMKDGKFKYYTRQSYDITNYPSYGETSESGFLSGAFSRLLNPNCKSIILDGELMGWHKARKEFGSKGMSYDVKKLSENSAHQPCFVAFDILLYNDELLLKKPYAERLRILETVFQEEEGSVIMCRSTKVCNSKEVCDIFNQSMRDQDEGIVLKKSNVTYKPNVREGSGCYKIKAEYSSDLVNDVDLIILGGYYGDGRFTGLFKSFLMGVAVPPEINGSNPDKFLSVVSVSNGFTTKQLQGLNERFQDLWIDEQPSNVVPPRLDPPDKWVHPEKSLVLTLRATELSKSNDYPTGYSLRFPRVMSIREDKPWYNTCTTIELQSLIKDTRPIQKLTKREVTEDDVNDVPKKNIKRARKTNWKRSDEKLSAAVTLDAPVVPITRLFNNKEFCVMNGNDEMSKEEIERILLLHSAKVVQNPSNEDCCIIVGNAKTVRATNVINTKMYDVVRLDWLNYVTKEENWSSLKDFRPWDLLCSKESTKERLAQYYDQYHDHFYEPADHESLEHSFDVAANQINTINLHPRKLMKLDRDLFADGISPYSIFRNTVGYFVDETDCAKYDFRFMAGTITEDINESTTYIFIDNTYRHSVICEDLKKKYENSITIVKSEWIAECLKHQKQLPTTEYLLV